MYTDGIDYSGDSTDYGVSDGSVGCALPDAGRVLVAALGVVVVALALAAWGLRKLRPW